MRPLSFIHLNCQNISGLSIQYKSQGLLSDRYKHYGLQIKASYPVKNIQHIPLAWGIMTTFNPLKSAQQYLKYVLDFYFIFYLHLKTAA